jgi:hypothetical protein
MSSDLPNSADDSDSQLHPPRMFKAQQGTVLGATKPQELLMISPSFLMMKDKYGWGVSSL